MDFEHDMKISCRPRGLASSGVRWLNVVNPQLFFGGSVEDHTRRLQSQFGRRGSLERPGPNGTNGKVTATRRRSESNG